MKNKLILSISLACGIFAFILIADLLSKHFIFQALPNAGDSMEVISGFFNLLHVENTGAAWGMLAGRPIFLILVSLIILAVYLWFYVIRLKKHKGNTSLVLSISVGFIVGGCFGNLIDRVVFGYVRDFINLQFMDFPVFNIADISLTIGIILMIIYFIFIYNKEDKMQEMLLKDLVEFRDNSEIVDFKNIEDNQIESKNITAYNENNKQNNEITENQVLNNHNSEMIVDNKEKNEGNGNLENITKESKQSKKEENFQDTINSQGEEDKNDG